MLVGGSCTRWEWRLDDLYRPTSAESGRERRDWVVGGGRETGTQGAGGGSGKEAPRGEERGLGIGRRGQKRGVWTHSKGGTPETRWVGGGPTPVR